MIKIKKFLRRRWNCYLAFINFIRFLIFDLKKVGKSNFIFILPVYHTGGAERVHLNIVKSLKLDKILVIFAENSSTRNFLKEFKENAEVIEINSILTKKNRWVNKLLSAILIHRFNNSTSLKVLFGCNTYFYYKLIDKVKESVIKIDLFHAFDLPNDHRENTIITSANFIDHRVLINTKAMLDIQTIYSKNKVDSILYDKLMIINNGINLPNKEYKYKRNEKIKIGFLGRWSDEKRPKIYLEIAKQILSCFDDVRFIMAGIGMKGNIQLIKEAGISFLGEIVTEQEMNKLYDELTFILVPSKREGFPMVIMEAMANSVIPIATNVGGVSEHIQNNENGILIYEQEVQQIKDAIFDILKALLKNEAERERLSKNAFDYAQENFGIEKFQENYRKIFGQIN